MSIRLSPDGLSFWTGDAVDPAQWNTPELEILSNDSSTEVWFPFGKHTPGEAVARIEELFHDDMPQKKAVYIDTMRTVLVPADIYTEGSAAGYMTINNMEAAAGEQTDVSLAAGGTRALMVSTGEHMKMLGERFGQFAVLSPMQYNIIRRVAGKADKKADRKVMIYLGAQTAYISVFAAVGGINSKLIYSEVVPAASAADIIYFLNTLAPQFKLDKCPVHIKGAGAKQAAEIIRRHYKKTQCG